MKWPTMDEFAQMVADKAIDEIEYKGKTLRQWIEIILATDINVATKDGTNLAEVGMDCISRRAAIDRILATGYADQIKDNLLLILRLLPPAQPEIIRCKNCKHNPKYEWFGCPMSHLSEKQRPETAWCWKAERRTDERSD